MRKIERKKERRRGKCLDVKCIEESTEQDSKSTVKPKMKVKAVLGNLGENKGRKTLGIVGNFNWLNSHP